jgi:hypothetical protein
MSLTAVVFLLRGGFFYRSGPLYELCFQYQLPEDDRPERAGDSLVGSSFTLVPFPNPKTIPLDALHLVEYVRHLLIYDSYGRSTSLRHLY